MTKKFIFLPVATSQAVSELGWEDPQALMADLREVDCPFVAHSDLMAEWVEHTTFHTKLKNDNGLTMFYSFNEVQDDFVLNYLGDFPEDRLAACMLKYKSGESVALASEETVDTWLNVFNKHMKVAA